ncbi:nucleosome assembly protein I [Coprinopsis cinerea okayama7|uniref:Nucleosome assembly protein I n=1 Tax=Coprinopsis cinerea (strain Okayama-7 / 130 / ATCC MYA-4618 / FGSC 9003) TaxID=240176 RepID=A8NLJ6_COPC7|nr:nucleosome assembly protein I [Coprinopsis cinerea okayama7\|eukprot:XP_001834703.2 nucleosome assembly protein I [Coprinopsis cinerea okayama7\
MSSSLNINQGADLTAPTPQNTPLNQAPISLGLSRPTVPDISEDNEQEDIGEGRLAELVGRSSGYIESLPVEIKLNVEALKGVQEQQNELVQQYKLECLELEKKYLNLTKPLYERRKAIINGTATATKEEIEAGEKVSAEDIEEYEPLPKDATPSTDGIPEFWLTALRNHIGLNELITDRDADALKHLTDIQLEYTADGKPGFKLLFHFTPNDYFENDVLEKTYYYQEKVGYGGDFVYDRAIGTDIKWKEDKDLTKEFEIKKQRNKTTNRTRLVRKAKPADSFFNFFYPPVPPSPEAIEEGEIDEDELDEIEEKLEIDYQIGEDLKEKIVPRAIDYFTGKAIEYDFEDDDDYDLGDEDDDDDDDDDDEGSDSDAPRPAKKGGNKVDPEECKQQ